jgi:hypothetical protein
MLVFRTGYAAGISCAENNEDHFNQGLDPIPQTDKPDL